MQRFFFVIGAVYACMSVIAGAFGSHALKQRLSPDLLAAFEIGARYQMYHALALMAVGLACARWPGRLMNAAGWCFAAGTLFFSGSLYQLSLTGSKWLGIITPVGGGILMLGWLCAAAGALAKR